MDTTFVADKRRELYFRFYNISTTPSPDLISRCPKDAGGFTFDQWSLVYNSLSFGVAGMGSDTILFWFQLSNVTKNYRTALSITRFDTAIEPTSTS